MKKEDFLASRVEMSVTQYLNLYLSESDRETFGDALKVHVYGDGYYITQHPNSKFNLVIERSEFTFSALYLAEYYFWDNFAENELNPNRMLPNEEIAQKMLDEFLENEATIKEIIIGRLMDSANTRIYWDAFFRGAKGIDLHAALRGKVYNPNK